MRRTFHTPGVAGARDTAAALAAAFLAVAALGDKAGAPTWLRLAFGVLACVAAAAAGVLTWRQHTELARIRSRQRRDAESGHFVPLGRGVEFKEELGSYWVGRVRALRDVVLWLTGPREAGGLLVVTGDPGSGKSAVLGRLWALSDPRTRREVAAGDVPEGTSPPERCIDMSIHAKGHALKDVVSAIADTIGSRATTAEELIQAVIKRDRALVVMVDALDEASEGEALKIAWLLRQLAERTGRKGVRVLVGSRRGSGDELLGVLVGGPRGPGDELLERIGVRGRAIDLDTERYFELDDLIEYARKRLLGADC